MRLSCVRGFRLREIARWSKVHLSPSTQVYSDGLWCFAAVSENGCTHHRVPMNRPDVVKRRRALKWVDTMLGNVKNALHGTYHAERLAIAATQAPPMPYRLIKLAEPHW
jgi:hypothetical protein